MGILNSALQGVLGDTLNNKVNPPRGNDFPEGLIITEIVNGKELTKDRIVLIGNLMPKIPFEYGGSQRIVKDYYPGNSEPVVQVLGAKEDDTTIKGRFYTKRIKDAGLITVAREYQELVDAMRVRGNLVKVILGEWRRYAFIEKCLFRMSRLHDIEYEITFSVVGFKQPTNCKFVSKKDTNFNSPNKDLIARAQAEIAAYRSFPKSMPRSISEFLNDQISTVASAINLVTDFVDGALADVESIVSSANRAVGLIDNASAKISIYKRQVGAILQTPANLAAQVSGAANRVAATYENIAHINKSRLDINGLQAMLARMKLQFKLMADTVPMRRHLVKTGDSLQRLAMKYYQNADLWKKIYDHNKLTSTVLVIGSVLEIPRE